MNTYVTDQEQIEMIKNWWRENGKFTLLSIITAILLSAGWRYWQKNKNEEAAIASTMYEQIINAEANKEYSAVEYGVTSLQTNHPSTPYASLAAFISAQNAIHNNRSDIALDKFDWVITHSKNTDFKQIAKIRKARILLELKKYDEGLTLLAGIHADAYLPLVNEIKGDILAAKGEKVAAIAAYQNALHTLRKDAPNRSFLQMKFDQIKS